MKCGRVAMLLVVTVLVIAGACAREADGDGVGTGDGGADGTGPRDGPRLNEDHWHAAFGMYVCGEFLPDLPENVSPTGIHTHGDGVIHIHPFSPDGAGANATLATFLDGADLDLDGDDLAGDECDGTVRIAVWDDVNDDDPTFEEDPDEVQFDHDQQAVTLAVVPEGDGIPLPSSADDLDELGGIGAPDSPTTTGPTTPPSGTAADLTDGFYPVLGAVPQSTDDCRDGMALPGADGECYLVDDSHGLGIDIVESAAVEEVQGQQQVDIVLTEDGIDRFNELAADCYNATSPEVCPTSQIAIVVGGEVVSAPSIVQPSFERDQISITGGDDDVDLEDIAEALNP